MKLSTMILALLLTVTLAGCLCPTMPMPPTKPAIKATPHPSDPKGRSLDGENLGRLMKYIVDLERGYK